MATIVNYTGDGTTNQYAITFDYISRDDVVVEVNDTAAAFTFVNDTTIQITNTPASGAEVVIQRATPLTALVDFTDGSTLFEADLDLSDKQSRFLAEEARDRADSAITVINNNIDDVNTVADNTTDISHVADQISPTNNIQTLAEIQDGTTATNAISTAASISTAISNVSSISSAVSTVSSDSADVQTLAGISADIQTLADIEDGTTATDAISDVAAIATQVTSVAGVTTEVTNVAGKLTEIERLGTADAVADLAILGTTDAVADMNTLAAISTDIEAVADKASFITTDFVNDLNTLATTDVVADLNTLATSDIVADINLLAQTDVIADLNTLATTDIVSDLNTLATTDIVADLSQLATSDFVSDLNTMATTTNVANLATVATDIANINAIAPHITGVNSFAERYRVDSTDPSTNNDAGDLFYNTFSNSFKFWDGTQWNVINTDGITAVIDDTTPQLGGDLDTNGNEISFDDGSSTTNRLTFGADDDLQIYHDGTNNIITGNGADTTSDTYIYTNDNLYIRKGTPASSEALAAFTGDGAASLMYNNSTKLTTQISGTYTYGNATATGGFYANGGYSRIAGSAQTPTLELRNTDTTAQSGQELGVIDFYGSDSTSAGAGVKASIKASAISAWGSTGDGAELIFSVSQAGSGVNETTVAELDPFHLALKTKYGLRFWDNDVTNAITIQNPSDITSSYTLVLPASGPSTDQILVTGANNQLVFEDKPTGANVATIMAFA